MKCKICKHSCSTIFTATLLQKYENIHYFYCTSCEFLFTEEPFWLKESYSSAISILDTGLVSRNYFLAKKVAIILYFLFDRKGKFVDFAGGNGLLTRLMRDIGFDFYWTDLYATNELAKGFEYFPQNHKDIEVVTTFESFEHFVNPMDEINSILTISTSILFTTNLLPSPIPLPINWWYYALESGQHIAFYRRKTLEFIAQKNNLHFYSDGGMHLFSKNKINKRLYNYLLKYSSYLIKFVQNNLTSKTLADSIFLKKN